MTDAFFFNAEVSNYTADWGRNKLEHAQPVVTGLIDTQVTAIRRPFDISDNSIGVDLTDYSFTGDLHAKTAFCSGRRIADARQYVS